jgi:hypothetical protein
MATSSCRGIAERPSTDAIIRVAQLTLCVLMLSPCPSSALDGSGRRVPDRGFFVGMLGNDSGVQGIAGLEFEERQRED